MRCNARQTIRNQQARGSNPLIGSSVIKALWVFARGAFLRFGSNDKIHPQRRSEVMDEMGVLIE